MVPEYFKLPLSQRYVKYLLKICFPAPRKYRIFNRAYDVPPLFRKSNETP
jgi:hypothetical protein